MAFKFHKSNPFADQPENPFMDGKEIDDEDNPFYTGPPKKKEEENGQQAYSLAGTRRSRSSRFLEVPKVTEGEMSNNPFLTPRSSGFLEVPTAMQNYEQGGIRNPFLTPTQSFLELPVYNTNYKQGETRNPFLTPTQSLLELPIGNANNETDIFSNNPFLNPPSYLLEDPFTDANNEDGGKSNNPFLTPTPSLKPKSSFQTLRSKASSLFGRLTADKKKPAKVPPSAKKSRFSSPWDGESEGGESGDEADYSAPASPDSDEIWLQQWRPKPKKKKKRNYRVYFATKVKKTRVRFQRRIRISIDLSKLEKKKKRVWPEMYWLDGEPRFPYSHSPKPKPRRRIQLAPTRPPLPYFLGDFDRTTTREELRYIAAHAKYNGGITYKRFAWRLRIMRERINKNFRAKYMKEKKKMSKEEREHARKIARRRARIARRSSYDEHGYRKYPTKKKKQKLPPSPSFSSAESFHSSEESGSTWESLSDDSLDYEALMENLQPWAREEILDRAVYLGIEQKRDKYNPVKRKALEQALDEIILAAGGPDAGMAIGWDELGLALVDRRVAPPHPPSDDNDGFVEEGNEVEVHSSDISSSDSSICDSTEIDFKWKTTKIPNQAKRWKT